MHLYLDAPQTIDCDQLLPASRYLLANSELRFFADGASDLYDLVWPWANACYAAAIRLRVVTPIGDPLVALSNRYYPGYQETILGNETIIVTKQLMAPFKSDDDRAALWVLQCQAEGDHLLRLEVEIDWGEALTQRMVDGLLVAQRNPGAERGVYAQSNAESTRVFGNPHARPDEVNLDDPRHARLLYHVLVNGEVSVALLLTVSDVGEQMAWSSFLSLRESEETFSKSEKAWQTALNTGQIWTPDPNLNAALRAGRIATLQHLHHLRGGLAPASGKLMDAMRLVASLDGCDVTQSRNLLAHMRRLAEKNEGRLPPALMGATVATAQDGEWPNVTYLAALHSHLQHHFDAKLLAQHYPAVQLCGAALIVQRSELAHEAWLAGLSLYAQGVNHALALATLQNHAIDIARWQSEVSYCRRLLATHSPVEPVALSAPGQEWPGQDWASRYGWHTPPNRPWGFEDVWQGIALAGEALWQGCGLRWQGECYRVEPGWRHQLAWWVLIDLPTAQGKLSLVWDGAVLHANQPLDSDLPMQLHAKIRAFGFEEMSYDPRFELIDVDETAGAGEQKRYFRPSA
jgi:hypothetical protein